MQWLRSFVAIAACAGLVALAGCGKKEDDGGPEPPSEPPAAVVDAAGAAVAPPVVVPDAAAAAAAPVDAASGDGDGDDNGGKTATKPPPPKKDDKPTNLKVLPKSWSRKKVEDYMEKHISKALGVKCDYCHPDEDDYAADNEHKSIALDMMKMERDINRRFFGGKDEVSCYTCHLGKEEPPK